MLVQFTVKNVLSFKEETTLDMTAIPAYKEHTYNLIDLGGKEKFLRVAAIYGANASGKSNLCLAMRYFQRILLQSFNNVDEQGLTAIEKYYIPFQLDSDKENSEFQIIEILGDFEYKYGFEYNDQEIVSEWLYRKNRTTNRTSVILERAGQTLTLGSSVKKECEPYQEQIPNETLALSFFNKLRLKTPLFQEVFSGIVSMIASSSDLYGDNELLEQLLPTEIDGHKEDLIAFLTAIDSGIQDIYYESYEKETYFYTVRCGRDGQTHTLPLFLESEGTLRSILIYMNARSTISGNHLMFIDELNSKLHPLLLKFIIDLFYKNPSTAQLIYTTHDTTLLDKKFFRRDQIWFVQKDRFGCSELTALSDFKVRSDASFEKDYLAGVYGGIPLLKEFTIEKEGSRGKR